MKSIELDAVELCSICMNEAAARLDIAPGTKVAGRVVFKVLDGVVTARIEIKEGTAWANSKTASN